MKTLYEILQQYRNSDYYPFHMPGHKRNTTMMDVEIPYGIDITEITGFDDLHHATGILKKAQERAAKVYQAEESAYLINGSTSGILSAILGSTQKGERILVARNCHKSVYHAIYLNELQAEYLYPIYDEELELNGAIDPEDVRKKLEDAKGEIRAVVIVSPTYDGVLSDIKAISDIVHEYEIPLIVDEAHGAHFGFHPYFPENANVKGADIVIHSLHKTLPALTQTALIHMNGNYVDRESVHMYLHMLQTSSPSYVLMASIDECIALLENDAEVLFDSYVKILDEARQKLKKLKNLKLIEMTDLEYDRSKIVISVKDVEMTGNELHQILSQKYHLELEMSAGSYVLAMTTLGDTEEGIQRLIDVLFKIDESLDACKKKDSIRYELPILESVYSSSETRKLLRSGKESRYLKYEDCVGYLSAEYAYLYPPGIPLLVPGERITEEAAQMLKRYEEAGFEIAGTKKEKLFEIFE